MGAVSGGSLLSAGGSIASGFANSGMYNYQAGIAKLNQQIDSQNAEFARQTGEQQALSLGLKQGQQFGQIVASQASSGFDVRSGSNQQVQASQRQLNQTDTDIIRSNAAKTAYGYELQGTIAGAQSSMYSSAASDSLTAGVIGAASSILGGAGSVSSMWTQGQRVGMFNATSGSNSSTTYGGTAVSANATGGPY